LARKAAKVFAAFYRGPAIKDAVGYRPVQDTYVANGFNDGPCKYSMRWLPLPGEPDPGSEDLQIGCLPAYFLAGGRAINFNGN
jgi:hypothetical protein